MSGDAGGAIRVGLLGRLGSGNIGNDASLEVVLAHLRRTVPDARLDAMCSGAVAVRERYGLDAVDLHRQPRGGTAAGRVLRGIVTDAWRISAWVRRHDVVIVPGMGTLESTLHERSWQMPWTLLVMALSGRVWGTRVALVGVGADAVPQRVHRVLLVGAARLAHYRSFRDEHSREEMVRMGLPPGDSVYPDLVLGLPRAGRPAPTSGTVGLGVMAWSGSNGDRGQAERLHAAYADRLVALVRRLLERGYRVRLLVGDADDVPVARRLLAAVPSDPDRLSLVSVSTPGELMAAVASVEVVVASRYHNVVCALRCGTPAVALAYAAKHRELLAQVGLERLTHDIRHLDPERLVVQVDAVHADLDGLRGLIERRRDALDPLLAAQLEALSREVLGLVPEVVR
ncbi:colanic acid biosynthesis protein [Nocardioides dokdonensis FR1436]|uniref:Colanic acid biosynthesis protein n=1 Tax=Nocardioides dokdonensis FR1436 TaxID=1300347 RepID=A0A1A9GGE7_9ACTN|nr:polysaccharide pyruvyl transferase family protein [Nocardioides dokdonensis]ANH36555.1 colanic acid biosynthesis protein [Nocardioides dokdonensis FR1436]